MQAAETVARSSNQVPLKLFSISVLVIRIDYGGGLLQGVKYFVARVYSYIHESTEVAEDHYHEECGIHQFKLHLVHTEVGTNKNSII